ncbi:MAG: hypothetical protein AAFX01_06225 [Cyanobacteria bacterium J06638_28]
MGAGDYDVDWDTDVDIDAEAGSDSAEPSAANAASARNSVADFSASSTHLQKKIKPSNTSSNNDVLNLSLLLLALPGIALLLLFI